MAGKKDDAGFLRAQAERYARLAALTTDQSLSRQLRQWAEELEQRAAEAEAVGERPDC